MVHVPIIFSRRGDKMNKKMITTGVTLAVLSACGVSAWAMYKKKNPDAVFQMKKGINKLSRDVEKNLEDMM